LKRLEKEVRIPVSYRTKNIALRSQTLPPHGAHGLLDAMSSHDPAQVWGNGVEALWQITMTLEYKTATWDALICRLLLWRAMVGEDETVVGEWARREVIRNLRTQ